MVAVNSTHSRKRRILLLLCAILIPGAVLITLGIRVARQEAELAENRLADDRREAVEQLRREMLARLETIKVQETSRLAEPAFLPGKDHAIPPVVFVSPIERDRFLLPWDAGETSPVFSRRFLDYQKAGETLEFAEQSFMSALNAYRYALASAASRVERCKASLWIGRVLIKAGKQNEAETLYRQMLKDCDMVIDEEGVAISLYAAERLISTGLDADGARQYVLSGARANRWWSPVEAYLLHSLLTGASGSEAEAARIALMTDIHDGEQVLALAKEIQRLGRPELSFHANMGTGWLAYGDEPWLITIIPAGADQTSTAVLAVSLAKMPTPNVRFLPANSAEGFALGEGFVDLRGEWEPGRFVARPVPVAMYGAGLGLVLAVMILMGYLVMRDVDREVQVAEMRSLFVASVSHELKTPLTAIRMFAETLEEGRSANPQMQSKYLRTIVNESERLSRLVDNVLDFARIEQDRKIYQMQRISLADVVRSATQAIQYPLVRQNFELKVAVDDDLPPLMADPDAVEQAILNLLANAMKYSGSSRQIDLQLRRDSHEAVIDVTDHGLGIAEENQTRIFEKFYRVRSAETDRVPGAGLGLTLVMHAVRAHGGRLLVSSALGMGSTFSIRLPFMKEEANA
jgi:signal transduction histidine kinase